MAADTLRIGIVGGGNIVRQRHMPGLAAIDGVEVVAVSNRRIDSTEKFASDYNIPRAATDWRDVVEADDVDVVWIGTTPYMHRPVILAALEAGKHVFCQARMCMNLDEARQIAAAAAEHADRIVRFCPPPMGMGCNRTMTRLLRDGFVGEVRQIHLVSANGSLLDPEAPLTWRLQREQSGEQILTMGIYFEVLNRWFGLPGAITAVNRTWTRERPHPETGQPVPAELPESVNVIAEWPGAGVGVCLFNGVSAHAPSDHLAVYGTSGTIVYHFHPDETKEWIEAGRPSDAGLERIDIPSEERGRWQVEAEFIRAVRTGECDPLIPDVSSGLDYMRLVDAVHRSAAIEMCVTL